MSFETTQRMLMDLHEVVLSVNLDADVIGMYRAFTEQYKQKNGSYKRFIGTDKYIPNMDYRDDCVLNMINETIESRLMYGGK